MPTLDWIGKNAVTEHHKEVPFKILAHREDFSFGEKDTGNMIVEGDNLEALKALLPYYKGKVKCIYIDPPYNTGNENWSYNDKVNSPQIKEWLGKLVNDEDLSRHDKWLCMMYPRLMLLREMLGNDGIILISIGDDELCNLLMILNEIFGVSNQQGIFVWKSRLKPTNAGEAKYRPQKTTEYVLAYSKNSLIIEYLPVSVENTKYKYPHKDKNGTYRLTTILTSNRGMFQRETMRFEINNFKPNENQRWKAGFDVINNLFATGYLEFKNGIPFKKHYEHEENFITQPLYTFIESDFSGTAESGKTELNKLLGLSHKFDTVKPVKLIEFFLKVFTKDNDLVLDSFSGSGTTAHAVLDLNRQDSGNRKFILIEMEKEICQNITSERIRRVIKGYGDTEGLGGGFDYYQLGETLFDEQGKIRETITFSELARHVFFAETGTPLEKKEIGKNPLLGIKQGLAVYLLYNGILKDKTPNSGNVLTRDVLQNLPPHNGAKVIYGTSCRLSRNTLRENSITFKQIPYEIKIS